MTDIVDYERDVLRMLNGEKIEGMAWGAAMGQSVELLYEGGYVTRKMTGRGLEYVITDKGRAALTTIDRIVPPRDYSDESVVLTTAGTLRRAVAEIKKLRQAALFDAINTLPDKDATIAKLEAEITALREEVERLRGALEMFACDCAVHERCAVPDNCRNFQARRAILKGGQNE